MTDAPRRPATFRLNDPSVMLGGSNEDIPASHRVVLTPEPDPFAAVQEPAAAPVKPRRRGLSLGGLFWSALGGLVSLSVGLWATRVVEDLFARSDWLGWLAFGLAALAGLAGLAIIWREAAGLFRLARIEDLRARADEAHRADDGAKAKKVVAEVLALYAGRPETAHARAAVSSHEDEIIDGSDRLKIAERELLASLDREATRAVAEASKRVSVVTAVSPRALVDLAFVAVEATRLIRRVGTIYGGRPGAIGFLKLARHVGAHLVVTGGVGAGDDILSQVLGHGLAAKLSARLGEGVLNGLLTARVGLAAIAVCRPLPFIDRKPPTVREVAGNLFEGAPK